MKLILPTLLSFQLFFYADQAFSQSSKITISKEPSWITKLDIDYQQTSLDKHATDGYMDIDYEEQISLQEQTDYVRRSKKVLTQAGVQNVSEITASFDPSYEQLSFHSVRIIRNEKSIDKLSLSKIKTIHQEKELTNFIYNGSLNALIILEDVRVGDIIEYSYSLKGFNPIFRNKYSAEFSMNFSVPLYQIYYKLIVPKDRKINTKSLNGAVEPTKTNSNDAEIYAWEKKNVLPLLTQDYIPSWYDPYSRILISEFNDWKEVNDWAMELFPIKKDISTSLKNKIAEINSKALNDEQKISLSLKFVQDEIRYMGIEMGVNSHKPADPSKVFAQRFGDCKEKSYLLSCMLMAMNIECNPVLINTVIKKSLTEQLPSATDFDHVVVRVKLNGSYYWFDPTISYQRGDIKELFFPDYQTGLVISDSTTALTNITFRNNSSQFIKEYFRVTSMTGDGTLRVTTNFYGSEADNSREQFNNSSIAELMKSSQKFYGSYLDNIVCDSITYSDDDSTGVFTTIEYYKIPNFWKEEKGDLKKFIFSAFSIGSSLRRIKEKQRTMPVSLSFPFKYREELTIELPKEWSVTETEVHKKNACYAYNYRFFCISNIVHLNSDFENLKDYASVEEAPEYFRDLNDNEDFASFEISSGNEINDVATTIPKTDYSNLWSILLIGAAAGGAVWWSKRR